MQCNNYISDDYNKPNRLKIGWKLSKLWLFKKYMNDYQQCYGWAAYCGKMAASGDVLDAAVGHLVNIYIYGW